MPKRSSLIIEKRNVCRVFTFMEKQKTKLVSPQQRDQTNLATITKPKCQRYRM